MTITFDRSVCCDLNETISREWLISNGLGGYAAGTIAGVLTRMEHGLLVASLPGAATPELLLAKIDEEVVFDERTYFLGTNEYKDGTLNPSGFVHLETFRLEEGFPIFTYRLGGIDGLMLEKRIWMPQGRNTTYIQYHVLRTTTFDGSGKRRSGITGALSNGYGRYYEYAETTQRSLTLTLLPLVTHRPYNRPQYGNQGWQPQVQQHRTAEGDEIEKTGDFFSWPTGVAGCTLRTREGAHPYHVLAVGHPDSKATFIPTGVWYWKFLRRHDEAQGRPPTDDLYLPGVIRATLWPSEEATLTIIVSAEELSSLSLQPRHLHLSYTRAVEEQQRLLHSIQQPQRFFGELGESAQAHRIPVLSLATTNEQQQYDNGEEFLQLLLQAGNRFIARYRFPQNEATGDHNVLFGQSEYFPALLSNYYNMEKSTRATLMALPGLLLTAQRYDEALRILRTIARSFKQGLLPGQLPTPSNTSQENSYNSVDTTLWYFYALDAYVQATHNYDFIEEVYHRLADSINWYLRGTSNGIGVDPSDGLLRAEQKGMALTWMNAVVDGVPITPRSGKAVEVNALWYNALSLMQEWSQHLSRIGHFHHIPTLYAEQLARCKESFQRRFWHNTEQGGYLYDVIDGPEGEDASLRPNQLLACSLRYPIVAKEHVKHIFEATMPLCTPYGLRSLAPSDAQYHPQLGARADEQLRALHQGSVWSWFIGPYIDTLLSLANETPQPQGRNKEYLWQRGIQLLEGFQEQFQQGLLAMDGGVFDGDAPHHHNYYAASVVGIAELLRSYAALSRIQMMRQVKVSA